jgi:DNA polymerase-1
VTPVKPPEPPRLFLVDGYALIYRAFYALISRPLRTSRGENTSAAWGIVNFLQRLLNQHRPEFLGWVHDSGLSFRHERYPAYKATREKLSDELQDDFDRGMERICQLLEAFRIPIITCPGYEADDVIGTLARQGVARELNVVIVSGDKDFQQLVQPRVWLLNPGRGGPASVEESWVSVENGSERLGVAPAFVTDYLALVGDSSDNVPGVRGIGDKTACELVAQFGGLEAILANVDQISKKRPREALQQHEAEARLSKELVTIRDDLDVALDLGRMQVGEPDWAKLRELYLELEFTQLAKAATTKLGGAEPAPAEGAAGGDAAVVSDAPGELGELSDEEAAVRFGMSPEAFSFPGAPEDKPPVEYVTVDTVQALNRLVKQARKARTIAVDTETVIEPDSPQKVDPLRSKLVSISIAVAPGEAYYLPLAHRPWQQAQGDLLLPDASMDRAPTDSSEDAGLVRGGDEIAVAAGGPPQEQDGEDASADGQGGAATKKPKSARKKAAPAPPASIAARLLAERQWPVRNLPPLDSEEMRPLVALLEDPAVPKTAQNAKYDILALRRAGVRLRGLEFDTMIASYVLDPGRRSHGLDVLALEFLEHVMTGFEDLCGKGQKMVPFDAVPIDAARDYSCEDADMTLRLREMFEPQLGQAGVRELFDEVEIPLVEVLAEMEWNGVTIDVAWFRSLKERFAREREAVEKQIYEAAGREFNINSNPQLRQILFDELKLPVVKKTATGPSTDASVLTELAEEGHALPRLLMEYRELAKLESTYLDALPLYVNPHTGRIHTSYSQTIASTGRLSSNDPNLQNIPIRKELGRDIRKGFVPRREWLFLTADYSQIELRLLAHLSQDPAFVEAFNAGGDIHRQTAAIIFDVPLAQVTKEMRGRAKTINFATIYGQGAHALSRQLQIEFAEAKEFIARYFERFIGIRQYLDQSVAFAREHGYVQTIFGRRRFIPELRDRSFNIRAFGERLAQNSPIQGSAADLIKIAMINVDRALREGAFSSKMLLQVHDELVFEVPPPERETVTELVRRAMEQAAALSVPLVVDVGVGRNWLEAKG